MYIEISTISYGLLQKNLLISWSSSRMTQRLIDGDVLERIQALGEWLD